jgi:hypothetical protein
MKKITNRFKFIYEFVADDKYNNQIKEIARKTVLTPDTCLTITEIKNYFEQIITKTDETE